MFVKSTTIRVLVLLLVLVIACTDKKPTDPDANNPQTGTELRVEKYDLPASEKAEFPPGFEIIASEGMEIAGDISCDGDFTLTATNGDIVISGDILFNDSSATNTSKPSLRLGKSQAISQQNKAADGFSRMVNANNGNIILRRGATIFSGRGQHATDVRLSSISTIYEAEGGGNGGLITLNAPNGSVRLPDISSNFSAFQDEVFVLGNGGDGANIELDPNLEVDSLHIVQVRGGLGGNSGKLIIIASQIEGEKSLQAMETHPDFIYGGRGGRGGYVIWENAGNNKKYELQDITLFGGDGGQGARQGGNGGLAYFNNAAIQSMVKRAALIPEVFCYGGHGGDVFASPLALSEVFAGTGGAYSAEGAWGWSGGEDDEGHLIRDGAIGGNAVGQGGDGGDIQAGVNAFYAEGGSGGNSDAAQTEIPAFFASELTFLSGAFGVTGGDGGSGYSDCEGCPGGDGGNAGKATAIGGKGGDVLGMAVESFGGEGGDIWALLRGIPGDGGDGNPGGDPGNQQPGTFLSASPGDGGTGGTSGNSGQAFGIDLNASTSEGLAGEDCGLDQQCEADTTAMEFGCRGKYATATYYRKRPQKFDENGNPTAYRVGTLVRSVEERNSFSGSPTVFFIDLNVTFPNGDRDSTVAFTGRSDSPDYTSVIHGYVQGLVSFVGQAHCSKDGVLQWPGEGRHQTICQVLENENVVCDEWEMTGCISFLKENDEHDRENTTCCEDASGNHSVCMQ